MTANIAEPIRHLAVPIDSVKPYGKNPRQGNVDVIRDSLRVNGQYRPIVVNRRTGEILGGNHTWLASKSEGWSEIAVTFVDVDAKTARRILAVDNRASDLAGHDDQLLAELLAEIAEDDDLAGTGYELGDLDALAAILEGRQGNDDGRSDESVLDDTDRASWPTIRAQVSPDTYARWNTMPGEDDAARVVALLDRAGL